MATPAVTLAASTAEAEAALGKQAAEAIFHGGLKAVYEQRSTAAFARAAVTRLGELIGRQGLVREMVEGAKQGAEALNVEAFHGVVEVVQNAEDQGASEVRLGKGKDGADQVLLLVHNGSPVAFHQLVAMSFAFLSTKREDAKSTGRFGVGLKTLSRIATNLEIHGNPFHVEVETAGPRNIRPAADIPGFYHRGDGDTLLRLRLARDFDWEAFEAWFHDLGSDLLLFLSNVHQLRLVDVQGAASRPLGSYRVRQSRATSLELPKGSGKIDARRVTVRDSEDRVWVRVSALFAVPADHRRKNKATGESTEIAVAVNASGARARMFAGLPLRVGSSLPVAINAQFDPDTARFTMQEGGWNRWVLRRAMDLLEGVARYEAQHKPADAWRWIPALEEATVPGQEWLTRELDSAIKALQRTLARVLLVRTREAAVRLSSLVYESPELSGFVTVEDLERLRPGRLALGDDSRDRAGRWRLVLAELGGVESVDVAGAMLMFDWPDTRPPEWYLELASRALTGGIGLAHHRTVLRADGTAAAPQAPTSGDILVLDATASRAAVELGLAVPLHAIYSGSDPGAASVRAWLERHSVLRTTASGRDALNGLLRRKERLHVTDDQLRLLREVLFNELTSEERRAIGPQVGRAILVDGYEFDAREGRPSKPRRRRLLVSPADAYLPAAIDATGKRSWPTAAGAVPGLRWVAGRYRDVLTTAAEVPGARAVFTALGAAVTPRLQERDLPDLKYGAPAFRRLSDAGELQDDAVARLSGWVSHVRDERLSPDLDLVVDDLVGLPVRARRERARALLFTIVEHWRNDFADAAEVRACHSSYGWVDDGGVPAAWLSRLASRPWLSNEKHLPRSPMELAVSTPRALEVFGSDQAVYGWEFAGLPSRTHAALEALGVRTEPKVSDVIEALKDLRSQDPAGTRPTAQRGAILYDILADDCAALQGEVRPEDAIGDMTVRGVRAAFGIARSKGKGLIVARGGWWSPHMVFRGKPIFGRLRAFVPERRRADRLWEVLNVRGPEVPECVDVLTELSQAPLRVDDLGIMIDTYRHLVSLTARNREEREALGRVPLWSGDHWISTRPIFAVDDPQVSAALGEHEPTWDAPVPMATLGELPARLGVTVLDIGLFSAVGVDGAAFGHGARLQERYRLAVGHLYARFARGDVHAFEHLRPGWRALEEAGVALTANLAIEVRITGRQEFTVPLAAHVQDDSGRLVFAIRSEGDAGEEGGGGRAIASLFGDQTQRVVDREKIALAWAAAWASAVRGVPADRLVLADDREPEPDPLAGLQDELRKAQSWRTTKGLRTKGSQHLADKSQAAEHDGPTATVTGDGSQPPLAMRYLKRVEDLAIGDVNLLAATNPTGTPKGKAKRGGLASPPENDRVDVGSRGGPGAQLRGYSDEARERLAVEILRRVLETDRHVLRDLRKVANLGADVVDNVDKYFEIKASAGDMPDVISLQYSELERSLERPAGHWFLVVVSGLERGYETRIRFIADPLKHLSWADHGSVSFSGVRKARAVEVPLPLASPPSD